MLKTDIIKKICCLQVWLEIAKVRLRKLHTDVSFTAMNILNGHSFKKVTFILRVAYLFLVFDSDIYFHFTNSSSLKRSGFYRMKFRSFGEDNDSNCCFLKFLLMDVMLLLLPDIKELHSQFEPQFQNF